jgi:hypothetical protein
MIRLRSNINEGGPGGHGWEVPTGLRFEDLRFLVELAFAPFLDILVDGWGLFAIRRGRDWLSQVETFRRRGRRVGVGVGSGLRGLISLKAVADRKEGGLTVVRLVGGMDWRRQR